VNLQRGVRIRRSDLDIPLSGQPTIELGKTTTIGGAIDLEPGGRFQSWGKTWVIEAGRVIFDTPDPADPHLPPSRRGAPRTEPWSPSTCAARSRPRN